MVGEAEADSGVGGGCWSGGGSGWQLVAVRMTEAAPTTAGGRCRGI